MKISTFGDHPVKTTTWIDNTFTAGAPDAHWNVIFDKTTNGHSITEGGSSGSPLFNENKQIVGTLTGGNSTCRLTNGNNYTASFLSIGINIAGLIPGAWISGSIR